MANIIIIIIIVLAAGINHSFCFIDSIYIRIDKAYGDVKDEFVWAQTWYDVLYYITVWMCLLLGWTLLKCPLHLLPYFWSVEHMWCGVWEHAYVCVVTMLFLMFECTNTAHWSDASLITLFISTLSGLVVQLYGMSSVYLSTALIGSAIILY